jgi:hypothetical protein
MMFAAANFLAYSCQIRMVWFPDINHIESNAEHAVFVAAGLPQINEKVSFLARLPYGPRKNAGHWHSQMRQAFEAPTIIQQETFSFSPVSFFSMPFLFAGWNLHFCSVPPGFRIRLRNCLRETHHIFVLLRRLFGLSCNLAMLKCALSSGSTCLAFAPTWVSPALSYRTRRRLCVSAFLA